MRSDDVEPNRHRYGSGLGFEGREDRQDESKRRYVLDAASRAQKALVAISPTAINDAVLAAATTSK